MPLYLAIRNDIRFEWTRKLFEYFWKRVSDRVQASIEELGSRIDLISNENWRAREAQRHAPVLQDIAWLKRMNRQRAESRNMGYR